MENGAKLTESKAVYEFDRFRVCPANRLLLRDGEVVPLTSKVFDILLVFVENSGRVLEKEEMMRRVWQDSFVEEGNLTRNVSTLRKALGDDSKVPKYIVTVQGYGYRFIADVAKVKTGDDLEVAAKTVPPSPVAENPQRLGPRRLLGKWLWAIPVGLLLLTVLWVGKEGGFKAVNHIKSLAVLPLKSLGAGEDYLGSGIADAVIRRASQTGQLTVRPTSAVLHYLKNDTDALTAARELNVDAVLEGTVQRADGRLRVSVNLLRTSDGKSLWADSFDMPATDVFVIQDKVAQHVATRLRIHLDPAQEATLKARYPTHPLAYEFYIKGIFSLDQRGYGEDAMPQMEITVDFLKKAIEADPTYTLARAQLAFAYAWTGLFIRPGDPEWADLARKEINRSKELGPQLAETHLANALLLWSAYESYQNDLSVRELLLAKQLNPNSSHGELAAIYQHIGLDDEASRELQRALDIDPTSQSLKDLTLILPYLRGRPDEWMSEYRKADPAGRSPWPWYLLRKGLLEDARKAIDERLSRSPDNYDFLMQQALLFALKGDFRSAEARVPGILAGIQFNDESRHHSTYDAACIYALAGKGGEAVKWLKETATSGFPNYPLFERDPYLDRIRRAPEFVKFLADAKVQWEGYRQNFGG
jgi:DNA-binding winged helix-turn-helix (wHTH) protein/TolB-like protein